MRVRDLRVEPGSIGAAGGEAIGLDRSEPTQWTRWRTAAQTPSDRRHGAGHDARDLGPARGIMTGVAFGLVFWLAALAVLLVLTN